MFVGCRPIIARNAQGICEGWEFIARLPGTNAQLKICC